MKKKRLKELANQIVELEKSKLLSKDEKEMQMANLIKNLSLGEMMEVDEYIIKNKLLN